ncbi:uncharacterized protein TNCV_3669001 [Trichonephila clavipes]|nr:uncharacterized protein TNCV_3669001 [Trichonephila clavipes]
MSDGLAHISLSEGHVARLKFLFYLITVLHGELSFPYITIILLEICRIPQSRDLQTVGCSPTRGVWHVMQKTEFQMLNDDEIVTSMQENSDPVDNETDELEDNNSSGSSKDPSNVDTLSALKTAMEWYEQQ